LAGEVNTAMPYHVVDSVATALNDRKKPLKGSRIMVLGVAYKKDVDDLRESPSLKIIEQLTLRGAKVDYNDPHFPEIHKLRHYNFEGIKSTPFDGKSLAAYDCVLIATDHTSYDYPMIVESSQLVVDTRNATRRIARNRNKIVLV
jgi:UDP-N-acetyl-D-glucosamine dehydrogenase